MTQDNNKPAKFYEFSAQVGTATIGEIEVQFCDHVQKVDGVYYATAFYEGEKKTGKDENGIIYQQISNASLAFIPENMIENATAKFDDYDQTKDMIARLAKTVKQLNSEEYHRHAA